MSRYRSQKVVRKQRRIFRAKLLLFFLALFAVLYLLSWLSQKEKFNIQHINVTGNFVIQTEEILTIVNEHISGDYLWFFSRSNFLLYPKSQIRDELISSFLRIKVVDIKFADFQSITIGVEERTPFAIWCDYLSVELPNDSATSSPTRLKEECYFMDDNAFIFEKAPNFSNNVYFKYTGDLIDISTTTNNKILSQTYLKPKQGLNAPGGDEPFKKSQFEKVNLFIRFLKDININAYKLSVKENGDYELFFGQGSRLIFGESQDFDAIFENLRATLIDLGDLEVKEFEYIDLRFRNKILYKFRE